jgi:hypothetical protein
MNLKCPVMCIMQQLRTVHHKNSSDTSPAARATRAEQRTADDEKRASLSPVYVRIATAAVVRIAAKTTLRQRGIEFYKHIASGDCFQSTKTEKG